MTNRITTFDDPVILDEAVNLYQAGTPTTDLADKYGCSFQVVIRALRDAGVTIRPRGPHDGRTRKSPTLPKPLVYIELPWVTDARCRTDGTPDMFFPGHGQAHLNRYAKAICKACPVLAQCRDWALDNAEEWGVWGGLSERERRAIIRARRKAAETAAEAATDDGEAAAA